MDPNYHATAWISSRSKIVHIINSKELYIIKPKRI